MILISIFTVIFLTSLTGTLIFLFWKVVSIWLERFGEIKLIRSLLYATLIFYLIPVVVLWLMYGMGVVSEGKAGGLLAATPLLIEVARWISVVWLVGFIAEVIRYVIHQNARRQLIKYSMRGGERSKRIVGEIKEQLHIKRNIPIYELKDCKSPCISGFLKYQIFIPEKIENEEELKIILEHELRHYVQGDLHMKEICAWIVRIQWFNPFVHWLVRQVDIWGDSVCDLYMCYGSSNCWGIERYFDVVIKYSATKKIKGSYGRMDMARSRKELKRRIVRMKKLKTQKRLGRALTAALVLCFALASAVTSLAAGEGVGNLYRKAYEASMEQTYEASYEADETELNTEEFTRERDGNMEIVETDEEVNLDQKGVNAYTWDLEAGVIYETGLFWASKGDTIAVTMNPSPKGARTGVGLDQPNGILRGVTGVGVYSHTFTVSVTGFHRVYAENLESKDITVAVTVSR
ncbi:MAG: M56 family metallopeptidase [Lachnospiraceae bacterium]|nr:M56 family metallopeptidase [Lachnospiraceae bacterium]